MDATTPPARRRGGPAWAPLPSGLRPMLAVPMIELAANAGWSFEPKWPG